MLVALAGNIGVGKDSIARELEARWNFKSFSFAGPLKQLAHLIFHCDPEALYGPSPRRSEPAVKRGPMGWDAVMSRFESDTEVYAAVDQLFPTQSATAINKLRELLESHRNDYSLTVRQVLQELGTDWGRAIDDSVWIRATLENARSAKDAVITDCRFPNEGQAVKDAGGFVVWVDASLRVKKTAASKHASEPTYEDFASVSRYFFDNNGPESDLRWRVSNMMAYLSAQSP